MRTKDPELISQAKNEFNNLITLHDSEYTVKAYELFYSQSKARLNIVMCYSKDLVVLSFLIKKIGVSNEFFVKKIFSMLILGIMDIHRMGICHR